MKRVIRRSSYGSKAPHRYSDTYQQWATATKAVGGNPAQAAALAREHSLRFLGGREDRLSPALARELHYTNMDAAGRAREGWS